MFTAGLILSCGQQEGRDSSTGTQSVQKTSQPTSTETEPATRIQETGTNLPAKESPKNEDQAQTDQPVAPEPVDIVEAQAVVDQVVFALDDPDPEVREDALDTLESITDQEFESSQDARDWWNLNWNTFQFDQWPAAAFFAWGTTLENPVFLRESTGLPCLSK